MKKDYLEKAIDSIQEFCVNEYGERLEDEDLKDLNKIQIMFTTYEDDNDFQEYKEDLKVLEVQSIVVECFANLIEPAIWIEYNHIEVYKESYGSKKDMLEQLESLDFDCWTNLDELDTYLTKLQNEEGKEQ